jgi:hypothetical protein
MPKRERANQRALRDRENSWNWMHIRGGVGVYIGVQRKGKLGEQGTWATLPPTLAIGH